MTNMLSPSRMPSILAAQRASSSKVIGFNPKHALPVRMSIAPCKANGSDTQPIKPSQTASRDSFFNRLPVAIADTGDNPKSRLNAAGMAFLGDSVWEAYVRHYYHSQGKPAHAIGKLVLAYVRHYFHSQVKPAHAIGKLVLAYVRHYFHSQVKPAHAIGKLVLEFVRHYYHSHGKPALEAYVRHYYHSQGKPAHEVSQLAQVQAAAGQQAVYYGRLEDSKVLTDVEKDVLRWGRNSSSIKAPKKMDVLRYKKATAFEVLTRTAASGEWKGCCLHDTDAAS
eukprot:gene24350-9967_t